MQSLSAVQGGTLEKVSKADMASLCTDGTMLASAKSLEESDFCCCFIEGKPCADAAKIHKSLDSNGAVLLCRSRGFVSIEDAMRCTNQK